MKFSGEGVVTSDSDLVAKCLFFAYFIINHPNQTGKTHFDSLVDLSNIEKSEAIVNFLNEFNKFKKKGTKF